MCGWVGGRCSITLRIYICTASLMTTITRKISKKKCWILNKAVLNGAAVNVNEGYSLFTRVYVCDLTIRNK